MSIWCLQRFEREGNLNCSLLPFVPICSWIFDIRPSASYLLFPLVLFLTLSSQVHIFLLLQVSKVPSEVWIQKESTSQCNMAISLKSTLNLLVLKISFFIPPFPLPFSSFFLLFPLLHVSLFLREVGGLKPLLVQRPFWGQALQNHKYKIGYRDLESAPTNEMPWNLSFISISSIRLLLWLSFLVAVSSQHFNSCCFSFEEQERSTFITWQC